MSVDLSKLRDYQVEPVKHILAGYSAGRRTQLNLSDTGTGKTAVGVAVMASLKLPTIVVVPKIAVSSWERMAELFGDKFTVIGYEKLRTGLTPYGRWSNMPPPKMTADKHWVCTSCQREVDLNNWTPCPHHPRGIHCIQEKKYKWQYGDFIWNKAVGAVVFDEVHRCSGVKSLNSEMLIGAKRQGLVIHGLSATPACSPLHMRAMGYALDLHTLERRRDGTGLNFYTWAERFGCRRVPNMGFKWMVGQQRQIETMVQIRDSIVPRNGVRVRAADIPGFPKCDITAELYDLDENGEIDRLYKAMGASLLELEQRRASDVDPDHPLTRMLRAHQKIELLKVPIACELARDYLDKGYSVALFVNFAATMAELRTRLETDCIIDGSDEGVKHRQRNIDAYQANHERLILVNNKAGGISVNLQDLDGNFPRVGLVFPCFSATVMRQVFGRLPRDGGKSVCHYRVMFAANSVEVPVHRALSGKLNNLDALNDGDMMPENLKLSKRSLASLAGL